MQRSGNGVPVFALNQDRSRHLRPLIANVIPVKSTLIGLVMKPRYSLRLFLIGTFVLGTISAFVAKHWSRVAPIQLDTILIGSLSDDPAEPIEEPTLYEIRNAINRQRQDLGADISDRLSGKIMELKVLAATTSMAPPRFVPLIGNARLHIVMFRCSVKLIDSDGSIIGEEVLVEKNAFRLIKGEPLKHQSVIEITED